MLLILIVKNTLKNEIKRLEFIKLELKIIVINLYLQSVLLWKKKLLIN